jgi:uncharacterized protein YndB with AHSA1/START domain
MARGSGGAKAVQTARPSETVRASRTTRPPETVRPAHAARTAQSVRPSQMVRGVGGPAASPAAAATPAAARGSRRAAVPATAPATAHVPAPAERRRADVSVQRALAVEVERVWQAWADPKEMTAWFKPRHQQRFAEGGTYRNGDRDRGEFRRIWSTSKGSFIRMSWENKRHSPGSSVQVEILARGPGRCTVRLTHARIGTDEERVELRAAWSRALDSLKSWVEKGEPVSAEDWSAATQGA